MDWPDHTAHHRQWQIGTTSIPLEPGKFFTHWPRWIDPDELTLTYVDQDGKKRCYKDRDNYAELACTDDQVPQQTTAFNHQLCATYDPNY